MINIGLIGTSAITEWFIQGSLLVPNIKINSVYSRSLDNAKDFASKHNIPNTFDNLEEMAKSDLIDCVYIASPNALHFEQAKLFLSNNKHVLCEKAFCSNTKELEELISISIDKNLILMEAIKTMYMPNFKAIEENLYKIGVVRKCIFNVSQYSSKYDAFKRGENPNIFNPTYSTGALMDLGVYTIHPCIQLFDTPNSLIASSVFFNENSDKKIDACGTAILNYLDKECIITYSKISHSVLPSEIQGELGTIIIDKISSPTDVKIIYKDNTTEVLTRTQEEDSMCYELMEFCKLIDNTDISTSKKHLDRSMKVLSTIQNIRNFISLKFPADN